MTQEDKDILLEDLCARLPYKVKVLIPDYYGGYTSIVEDIDIDGYIKNFEGCQYEINEIKPYLFPLSSMTDEERKEYKHFVAFSGNPIGSADFIDWLNSHHFDYRGLIPEGLAIDATGLNIYSHERSKYNNQRAK